MKPKPSTPGPSAVDLLENAVHLLRTVPFRVLAVYYVGALPFALAFLFFWSDMSRSAFARERLEPMAAVLTALYVALKGCQLMFIRRLWEHVMGVPLPPLSGREWAGLMAAVIFWNASALLGVPLSLIFVWWTWSFYECLQAAAGSAGRLDGEVLKRTWRLAWFGRGQNLALFLALLVAGLIIALNVAVILALLPRLLKLLFGIESQFTRSLWAMFNTTFLTTVLALAWLCLDPLAKAAYLLRLFHAGSIHTGEDIRAELRHLTARQNRPGLLVLVGFMLLGGMLPASGATDTTSGAGRDEPPPPFTAVAAPAAAGSPAELDHAIDRILERREYTWRLPREQVEPSAADGGNWFQQTLRRILASVTNFAKSVGRSIAQILRWIVDTLFDRDRPSSATGQGWTGATYALFLLLMVLLAGAIGYLIYRMWSTLRRQVPDVLAAPTPATPDLEDDSLTAAQLPEDEWLRLAQEMMQRGEFRLALRALYLGGLAHLAGRNLVTVARHKSNWDYAMELSRRAHALPRVMAAFRANVTVFDRVWYGRHEATPEVLTEFENNLREIAAA